MWYVLVCFQSKFKNACYREKVKRKKRKRPTKAKVPMIQRVIAEPWKPSELQTNRDCGLPSLLHSLEVEES